jgi:hypothetical protein
MSHRAMADAAASEVPWGAHAVGHSGARAVQTRDRTSREGQGQINEVNKGQGRAKEVKQRSRASKKAADGKGCIVEAQAAARLLRSLRR